MAAAARAGIAALGLELFAAQPVDGLTVFKVPEGIDGEALLKKLEKPYGFKLAGGQDTLKGKIVRLGHMGYIDYFEVLGAIAALELVLLEMGWTGRGRGRRRGGAAGDGAGRGGRGNRPCYSGGASFPSLGGQKMVTLHRRRRPARRSSQGERSG